MRVDRRAEAFIGLGLRLLQCELERGLGQVGHRAGDEVQRRGLLDVEHGQPLKHQLARHAQRAGQVAAVGAQARDEAGDGIDIGRAWRQQWQLERIAPPHALHKAAVGGMSWRPRADRHPDPLAAQIVLCRRSTLVVPGQLLHRGYRERKADCGWGDIAALPARSIGA